jgi:O-antigen/teichoic acid export membrane protein
VSDTHSRRRSLLRRAFLLHSDNLGRRVVSGASYQFLGILLRTMLTIGSTAVLARLLLPADFGYLAMATVITDFAALLGNFGFNALLIQRRTINRLQVDTVFWAAAFTGTVLAACVVLASFFAGHLFADERVGGLLRLLCLNFIISSFYMVPAAVLARLMRFRTEFWIGIVSIAVRTLTAIVLAYSGFGVWSLVAGSLVGVTVQAMLGVMAVPYWPRFRFHGEYLAGTWRTSTSYFGGGLLFYANMNLDLMLIGRQLGATSLGYYQNARSLTDEIRSRIAMPLQHVLFPAFSSLQTEPERMQAMVLRSARLLAAVTFPIGVGVSAMARELVPVLYGPKWLAMVPIMGLFGLSAALKASMAIATPLFNAHNRAGLSFRFNLISTALMAVAIWLALPHGIHAVAWAVVAASTYSVVPFWAALTLVGFGVREVRLILGPPALASAAMWISVDFLRLGLVPHIDRVIFILLIEAVMAGLVYLAALHLVSPQYLADFRQLLTRMRGR